MTACMRRSTICGEDIDRVDEVLVRLLNERARVRVRDRPAEEGAGRRGLPAGSREGGARARARASRVEGPLGPDAIARLFERIIDEARRLERRVVHGEDERHERQDHERSVEADRSHGRRNGRTGDRGADRAGRRASRRDGDGRAPVDGRDADGARRRRAGAPGHRADRDARRRARGAAHLRAVQAGQPDVQAGRRRSSRSATSGSAATRSSSWPGRARRRPRSRCAPRRRRCGGPARRSSAAARSSRAARRTASRASARKGCGCCATRRRPRT